MYMKKRELAAAICLLTVGMSQSSMAADASATLDWGKADISIIGIGGTEPGVTYADQATSLGANAYVPGVGSHNNNLSRVGWPTSADVFAEIDDTFAEALVSRRTLSSEAHSEAVTGPDFFDAARADSGGGLSESFSFDGPGVLSVVIPYALEIAWDPSLCGFFECDQAFATVSASAFYSSNDGSSSSSSNASFSLHSFGDGTTSRSGNLVFGIFASGPGNGRLDINWSASAFSPVKFDDFPFEAEPLLLSAVPEPETYAMMLAGLGVLVGAMRRRK
ncbi:MAG: PEP-CTERM sorting domain-containing protein [Burkholderiaceae bacterium]|nr:PEP-CTERM sorting domain-containing protein [Burkholderiaceae bacterium]MDH3460945.1 PEP-CTERM sorting domain-containing protein [Burkholderiaceae bacterium]